MPAVLGSGSFNVGRDCQIVLVNALTSQRVDLPNVMAFDCKQEVKAIDIDRLDGIQLLADLPKGWTGSFENERSGSGLDDVVASTEAAWYAGGVVTSWTLYQFVTEPDGSTSTYQFDSAAVRFSDAGSWKGDASIKQKVDFRANRRRRV